MPQKVSISKHSATLISWFAGALTILLLISMQPDFAEDDRRLLLVIAAMTTLMLNFGLTFSNGEISAAHTVGIMAYLLLATPANAIWAVSSGAFIGVIIREARRFGWQNWRDFWRNIWEALSRNIGQLALSLAVGGWIYDRLGGDLPLATFETQDIVPMLGFVAGCLTVYLILLIIYVRSRHSYNFREAILLNWQSLAGLLLVPIPVAVLTAVAYHLISNLAFAILCVNLVLMVIGIYGLSHSQHLYEQQVHDLSTLATISNAMRTNLNVESLLQTLYVQVAVLMNVRNFTIALYDPVRDFIHFPIHIHHGQIELLPGTAYDSSHSAGKAARQIFQYVIDNAIKLRIVPSNLPPVAWLGVPILTSEQTVGAMIIAADDEDRHFDDQDRRLLSTIAAQAGVALDNAQLYEQSRERANRLRTLTRVSTELSSTLNAQHVLDQIVEFAQEIAHADASAIFMWWDEAQQTLVLVRQNGLSDAFLSNPAMPLMLNDPNLAERQQPLIVTDSHREPHAQSLRLTLDQEGKRACVELVLRNANEILGILVVYFNTHYRPRDEDVEVLQTYANQAALAISNAQLYTSKDAALSRRVEQLTLLEQLGQELFSSRIQLNEIYERVLKRAAEGTGAHAGVLILKESETRPARPVAILGYSAPTQDRVGVLVDITRYVLKNTEPILIGDIRKDWLFPVLRPETRAVLSVPILHGVSVIGAITLESNTANSFGSEDMIFVMQVGAQIRIAVDNMNLIRSIESTRDRLQTILDSMTEAMLLVDTDGYIRLANPRVETLLGFDTNAIANESIVNLLQHSELAFAQNLGFEPDILHDLCKGLHVGEWEPAGQHTTYRHLTSGQLRYIERTDVAVYDQKGTVIGWLMVFVDTSEEHELTQAREDLYSMIIHDLRSPLTAIQASIKLINNVTANDPALRPIITQTAETAARAVRKLLNLVNSLLDIAKMESGTMLLEREPSAIAPIVSSVIQELAPLAQEMEVHLETNLSPDLPLADMDAEKVERVLLNLVDNAIKFTPSNSKIRICAFAGPPGNTTSIPPMLTIQVIDNGPGIPDAHKQRLFERYVQLEGQTGRRRGTGLGLTFCRLAVEAHGGRIWIEDNPGGGSIFCFTLPVETFEPGVAP